MSKYAPLREYLRDAPNPFELTFEEIDRLVGGLPPSAYRQRAWWANDNPHVQAIAWLEIGRRVGSVDLAGRRVRFG